MSQELTKQERAYVVNRELKTINGNIYTLEIRHKVFTTVGKSTDEIEKQLEEQEKQKNAYEQILKELE